MIYIRLGALYDMFIYVNGGLSSFSVYLKFKNERTNQCTNDVLRVYTLLKTKFVKMLQTWCADMLKD